MEKILVIDDEKATLSMFRLFLDAYGYSVYTAENGTEGLEIFRKEKPAIGRQLERWRLEVVEVQIHGP